MAKTAKSYLARGIIERLMPHVGDWKGDVSITFQGGQALSVEVEIPKEMVVDADATGLVLTPSGLAHFNMEVKKALFQAEQEYQSWRIRQLKSKGKGDK